MSARQHALGRLLRGARPPARSAGAPRRAAVGPKRPHTTYAICTTPRSGSWLLSEGLASTSLAGNPREWFNTMEEQEQRAQWRLAHASDLTPAAYLAHVLAKGSSANGVFGVKLHYYQFEELPTKLADHTEDPANSLHRALPGLRHIWLTRRDKERQAVSLFTAVKTDTWWLIDGAQRERPAPEPEFDATAVHHFERLLTEQDAKWNAYFAAHKIAPLILHYEDVLADYRTAIVKVLAWLGMPNATDVHFPPTRLKRQSDARSEEWLERYRSFKANAAHGVEASHTGSLQDILSRRALGSVSQSWREWIAEQRAARTPDESIVEVLTTNGYSPAVARAELARASADPYLKLVAAHYRQESKASALLNILGELRALDKRAPTADRCGLLTPDEFRDRYYAANRPVILQGLLGAWRAPKVWGCEYLKQQIGDCVVEVMANRNADPDYERNAARHRVSVRFAEYVEKVYSGAVTNDYNLVANNGFFQRFATHALLPDLEPSLPYLRPVPAGQQCFLWFGPAGTVTPLHHDTSNILIAHVFGRKRYRLIPPDQQHCVYNRTGVFGDVDCDAPDLDRYPEYRKVTIVDVVLEPGEVLFMPVGWWHHVRALDVSSTVSFTNFLYPNHFNWEPRP